MKNFLSEIGKHFAVTILYFAALSAAYAVFNGWGWPVIFLWLGGLIGAEVLDLDHLIYPFLTYRDVPISREVRRLAGDGRYGEALSHIAAHHKEFEPVHLVSHNCVMQTAFCVFAICMVIFSRQYFWIGLAMSVLLHLLKDEWEDLRNDTERLRAYVFRHFPQAPLAVVKSYVLVATVLFVLLSVLVIFPSN